MFWFWIWPPSISVGHYVLIPFIRVQKLPFRGRNTSKKRSPCCFHHLSYERIATTTKTVMCWKHIGKSYVHIIDETVFLEPRGLFCAIDYILSTFLSLLRLPYRFSLSLWNRALTLTEQKPSGRSLCVSAYHTSFRDGLLWESRRN